ncbi:hypothetical protein TURU_021944 [Turdus rufiventris]|nr:hypothetical protein TURU_021944 [Turdus rufiventris]
MMEMEKDQKVHPKTGEKADDVVEHIQQGEVQLEDKLKILANSNFGKPKDCDPPPETSQYLKEKTLQEILTGSGTDMLAGPKEREETFGSFVCGLKAKAQPFLLSASSLLKILPVLQDPVPRRKPDQVDENHTGLSQVTEGWFRNQLPLSETEN